MAFAAVQFDDDNGPPALVNSGWLTPRKREVFWPPFKIQQLFDEAIQKQPYPDEAWRLYSVKRIFFKSDDYDSARRKLNKLEDTFYDHSSDDDSKLLKQTKRRLPKRELCESDNDDEDSDDEFSLCRPPKILKCVSVPQSDSVEDKERVTLSNPTVPRQTPNLSQVTTSSPHINTQPASPTSIFSEGDVFAEPIDSSTTLSEFQEKVLKMLQHVKDQNSQILSILRTQFNNTNGVSLHLPDDMPFELPLSSVIDLQALEGYISDKDNYSLMLNYLSSWGGRNLTAQTNNILKRILRTQFACGFSFYGKKGKSAFNDFRLRCLVVDAVKVNSPDAKENKIEDAIKTWLKHAPQRLKIQCMKQSKE